jgi:hypothetical protein
MFPPHWFLPYDVAFQLLTGVVALAVGLYAFKGYLWIRERTLYALFLAFMLLAIGLFVKGLTIGYALAMDLSFTRHGGALGVLDLGYWAYYLLSVAAYVILVYAYSRKLREVPMVAAAGSAILLVDPAFELVLVVLLLIIFVAQLAHLMVKRSFNAEVVTISFALLLVSHVLLMFSVADEIGFIAGTLVQLAGFAALFALLYRLRGPS